MIVWGTPTATKKPETRPTDEAVLEAIRAGLNGSSNTLSIAHRLGYRPARAGRLAVHKRLCKMAEAGLVGSFMSDDSQWAVRYWCVLKDPG